MTDIADDLLWDYCIEDDTGDLFYVEDTATTPQSRLEEFTDRYEVRHRSRLLSAGPIGRPDDELVAVEDRYDAAVTAAHQAAEDHGYTL